MLETARRIADSDPLAGLAQEAVDQLAERSSESAFFGVLEPMAVKVAAAAVEPSCRCATSSTWSERVRAAPHRRWAKPCSACCPRTTPAPASTRSAALPSPRTPWSMWTG
ncbi:hypothetical protein ACU4GD_20320 [Cupriavidus basilensis]